MLQSSTPSLREFLRVQDDDQGEGSEHLGRLRGTAP